jgi:hypothetical protein
VLTASNDLADTNSSILRTVRVRFFVAWSQLMTTEPRTQDTQKPLHQFTPYGKLGFPDGVQCWCGARLEFAYHEPGQNARRTAFFDAHAACPYPESEGKPE